jgi:acyl-CoA reductase-like NAD-dependent aldehyde dehydrogenase
MNRLAVRKTLKLFIGGAFVRSESGRTLACDLGGHIMQAARATRKDARDAVRAARAAWPGWCERSAYNRGQIIYRLAEMMESRRGQLADGLLASGSSRGAAQREVDAAIDRVVFYAGWCDKIEQVLSTKNPVSSPHFNVSSPEPTGVVAIVAPRLPALVPLVSTFVPIMAAGNSVVVLAGDADPQTAVGLAECVATADVPAGVVNILTGCRAEVAPTLAGHMDVNALDLWLSHEALACALHDAACTNLKRVRRHKEPDASFWLGPDAAGLAWIEPFVEIKTVWHPAGV